MKRNSTKQVIGLVVVVLLIAGVALVFSLFANSGTRPVTYKLNKIQTTISDDEGNPHFMDVRMSVELSGAAANMNVNQLNRIMQDAASGVNFDRLDAEGTKYVKQYFKDALAEHVSAEQIEGIYIADIVTDYDMIPDKDNQIGHKIDQIFNR